MYITITVSSALEKEYVFTRYVDTLVVSVAHVSTVSLQVSAPVVLLGVFG